MRLGGKREDAAPVANDALCATGVGAHVSFDGDWLTIHRKGVLARETGTRGEKRIPLAGDQMIGSTRDQVMGPLTTTE